jgi:hypothetical protein
MPENMAMDLLDTRCQVSGRCQGSTDDDLCGLGIFWSCRWLGLSSMVRERSTRGRILEEPVREVGAPDDVLAMLEGDTPAWTALSGDDGRLWNKEEGFWRFFCRWRVILL